MFFFLSLSLSHSLACKVKIELFSVHFQILHLFSNLCKENRSNWARFIHGNGPFSFLRISLEFLICSTWFYFVSRVDLSFDMNTYVSPLFRFVENSVSTTGVVWSVSNYNKKTTNAISFGLLFDAEWISNSISLLNRHGTRDMRANLRLKTR